MDMKYKANLEYDKKDMSKYKVKLLTNPILKTKKFVKIKNADNIKYKNNSKQYNFGVDIIRIIAMSLVVIVHSTTFNGFLSEASYNITGFFVAVGRYFAFACIPLFVILSGYLSSKKEIGLSWYKKLIKILLEYLFCSILVFLFKAIYLKEKFTIFDTFIQILTFGTPYSWYINMYIGLFLLIPFLNLLYNHLESKKQKQFFLLILILIISLPSTCTKFAWNYWIITYPVMYYYIGCYIREYKPKINIIYTLIVIIATCSIEVLITTLKIPITTLKIPSFSIENHSNIFCLIVSISIFLLFYNLQAKKQNRGLKFLRAIANASLSFFLISYVFDELFRKVIFANLNLTSFYQKLPHLFYIVPIVIICSIISAMIIHSLTMLLIKIFKKIFKTNKNTP